jgi:hypothetical protein
MREIKFRVWDEEYEQMGLCSASTSIDGSMLRMRWIPTKAKIGVRGSAMPS